MPIQGTKIDVAGALNAATAQGILADARQIWLHLTDDTIDKSVIGVVNWPSLFTPDMISLKYPVVYQVIRSDETIGILTNTYTDNRCQQLLITPYSLVNNELIKNNGNLSIYWRENINSEPAPDGSWDDVLGEWKTLINGNLSQNIGIEEYPLFSNSESYVIGTVVRYTDDRLYRFTKPHTAGTWNTSEVEPWNIVRDWEDNHARILDCGNAFSKYGGARTFDCGKATN